jgi:hypothetical protein
VGDLPPDFSSREEVGVHVGVAGKGLHRIDDLRKVASSDSWAVWVITSAAVRVPDTRFCPGVFGHGGGTGTPAGGVRLVQKNSTIPPLTAGWPM